MAKQSTHPLFIDELIRLKIKPLKALGFFKSEYKEGVVVISGKDLFGNKNFPC